MQKPSSEAHDLFSAGPQVAAAEMTETAEPVPDAVVREFAVIPGANSACLFAPLAEESVAHYFAPAVGERAVAQDKFALAASDLEAVADCVLVDSPFR